VVPVRTTGKPPERSVSPDGEWAATIAGSTAVLSEARSKREVARLEHDDAVVDVAFSPGGRWLATSSKDGRIRLWPLQVKDVLSQACPLVPRNLTPDEWKGFGFTGPYHKSCPARP
jgi:WD40 repeat protein